MEFGLKQEIDDLVAFYGRYYRALPKHSQEMNTQMRQDLVWYGGDAYFEWYGINESDGLAPSPLGRRVPDSVVLAIFTVDLLDWLSEVAPCCEMMLRGLRTGTAHKFLMRVLTEYLSEGA